MKVIWKRPDGFHGAAPHDYIVIDIAAKSKIWLHKEDRENYPFRVSGGWQDETSTIKLNRMVNLLNQPYTKWLECCSADYDESQQTSPQAYIDSLADWLNELKSNLKGDKWEADIMMQAFDEIMSNLKEFREKLLTDLNTPH